VASIKNNNNVLNITDAIEYIKTNYDLNTNNYQNNSVIKKNVI